jgi:hypothetical protein
LTRLTTPVVAVVVGLAFAAPARAQDAPTKLWSEYPLVPKVEQAAPSPVGPFLPPSGVESPVKDGSSGTGYWLPLLAVVAVALLVAARFARPLAATGTNVVGRRVAAFRGRTQLRPRPTRRSRSRSAGRTRSRSGPSTIQYAPTTVPAAEVEIEAPRSLRADEREESVPFITRRSGVVRARYVVVGDHSGGRTPRRSRPFWLIGDAAAQQRRAEAAWDDLANDLRADGWELDTAGRYEYYVPLRRTIVTTLEPYIRGEPADSGEA